MCQAFFSLATFSHFYLYRTQALSESLLLAYQELICFLAYVQNKGTNQPGNPHILINVSVVHCQDGMVPLTGMSDMSNDARKLVFGVSDQVPQKAGCTATEYILRLVISD